MSAYHAVVIYCGFGADEPTPAGSGTEIRPGVVLTARHVLYRNGERARTLKVGWWRDEGNIITREAGPELWDDEGRDIALLKTDRPQDDVGEPTFSLRTEPISTVLTLGGYGFPVVSDMKQMPYPQLLTGDCGSALQNGRIQLPLTFDPSDSWAKGRTPEEIDAALKGASGAGLFDGTTLAAIFLQKHRNSQTYEARTVDSLMRDTSGFRAELNALGPETPLDSAAREALDALQATTRAKLQEFIKPTCCNTLDMVLDKIRTLLKENTHPRDATKLDALARVLVARFLSTAQGFPPVLSMGTETSGFDVPTMQMVGAEVFMAASENRPTEHRLTGTQDPPGKGNLNAPPPKSFSKEDKDDFADLEGRLGRDLDLFSDVTASVLNRLVGAVATIDDRESRRVLIVTELRAEYTDRRFYLAYPDKTDGLDEAIDRTATDFEGLVPVLRLNTSDPLAKELCKPLLTLAKILTIGEKNRGA